MQEVSEEQIKKAIKIVERMAGKTGKFKKMHSEIKQETPKIKARNTYLEEIKLPKLSDLRK
jgi:hypothetical protein